MTRALIGAWLAANLATAGACAQAATVPVTRFRNEAPVWSVDDRIPIPKPPRWKLELEDYYLDAFVVARVDRALAFEPPTPARNVNSLGEVPDSTWFTNRIGVREISVEEISRGPNGERGPVAGPAWTVIGDKPTGQAKGFEIADSRGAHYFIKFDEKGVPESETGADVVSQRLLWASGYNVPENRIVWFSRDQIRGGDSMTEAELDALLSKVEREGDGRWRALASRRIEGEPLGGVRPEGRRPRDRNDTVRHEDRRDLRGQAVLFSWLNHTDVKPQNTLEVWRPIHDGSELGLVVPYILDFGKTLGVWGRVDNAPWMGHRHRVDGAMMLRSLMSFGMWRRPWERAMPAPYLRGGGAFTAGDFDPGAWETNAPWLPFKKMDRFDAFWAAKIVMRFSPPQIRAAVAQANYSDRRTADYVTSILIARQKRIGRYWFQKVTPLDQFEIDPRGRLCFSDLWLAYGFETRGRATSYEALAYDFSGARTGWSSSAASTVSGRACLATLRPGRARGGYTIVAVAPRRGRNRLAPVYVHLARAPGTSRLRVIGLSR